MSSENSGNQSRSLLFKDRYFNLLEVFVISMKYRGMSIAIRIIYHYLISRFLLIRTTRREYKFLNFKFAFLDVLSVNNALFELFGLNVYYFVSKSPSPVILDIGANIGDSIIYFKHLYPQATIYAFEPHPTAFSLLLRNVKLNSFRNVFSYNVALGSENKSLNLFNTGSVLNSATSRRKLLKISSKEKADFIKVKMKTLDSFKKILRHSEIDLVKVDIEGSETSLLREMDTLLPNIRKIIIEFHFLLDSKENSFDFICTKLKKFKFKLSIIGLYRNSLNISNQEVFLIIGDK